jgi:hypothetical protein
MAQANAQFLAMQELKAPEHSLLPPYSQNLTEKYY